ncbi:MAG: transcriptional regulator [Syntrophus sp. RIFOXYC2_FULL_54_9]|nr:MAG: transcriptional regulator [Syntrophus sp. RIFOXYC2_FULL_54_9]
MKYIVAIIQPHKLEEVKQALEEVGVNLMTVTNVLGQGRQKGYTEIYRGAKEIGGLLRKVRLDIAVNEDFVEPAIAAINKGARAGEGKVGDGKIFVLDLADCVRISSGERGGIAIG